MQKLQKHQDTLILITVRRFPALLTPYAVMSDGSTRYRVDVTHQGVVTTLWFEKADDMNITVNHSFNEIKTEDAHPHRTYSE